MRVLFAVNDENISTSIVKKYQKEYKEIISYKNVYYFNAILKELQRNKNYDRIVISEDLEEFTSSSFEQKDKFIFDKLDNISDEAVDNEGIDIPIILICSERRNKSEEILIKLFGIGIYNAIIGDDRSIEEVCRLINKPRSKKEAKAYYNIDSEDVNYQKGKESDVKEEEIQNILMHFKKLGKNETKYVESFNNIVSQYNDEQLKVIIAVLPNNVKLVLNEYSPEYQRLVYPNGRYTSKKINSDLYLNKKEEKANMGKLLGEDSKEKILKPIIVPTTLEENMYKKVNPKKQINIEGLEDDKETDDFQEENPKVNTDGKIKKRGRPRKNPVIEEISLDAEKPKKRGRPRKNSIEEVEKVETDEEFINILPGFDEEEQEEASVLPGFSNVENTVDDTENTYDEYYNNTTQNESLEKYDNVYDNVFDDEFDSLLIGDKKVATFVGTSKNGTSFIVNNIAQILSEMGINTAILDTTKNRNSYYIYTNDDEELRKVAIDSIESLINDKPQGLMINKNLSLYTGLPSQYEQIKNSHPILENLVKKHSIILIDCDFDTPVEYFDKSQEIYLIQSMDVLTIQPLTEFLRELKDKGILEERKIRIILNKILRIRGVSGKNIIGGMSKYNNPEMSLMKELFNADMVKTVVSIPFDEDVYAIYLESLIECEIKANKYPKEFRQRLVDLAGVIYPLLPSGQNNRKNKKELRKNQYSSSFTSDMNDTLDSMRKRY